MEPGDQECKDAPEEIVSIPCFVSNGSDGSANLRRQGGRNKPWKEFHESFTHCGIPEEAETRSAESLEAI